MDLDAQRLSSWIPDDPAKAVAPSLSSGDKIWALVRLWHEWADEPVPATRSQRYFQSLIEDAQPERRPRTHLSGSLPVELENLLERQQEQGELWPYIIHDGFGARQPLSEVHVPQLLDAPPVAGEAIDVAQGVLVDEILVSPANRHLLVEAGPGGGKSTLMARLAGTMSEHLLQQGRAEGSLIPIWTTASHLATAPDGVDLALSRLVYGDAYDADRRFTKAMGALTPEGATWLIMVDGFDEVSSVGERARLTQRLATLAERVRADEAQARFVVASRPLRRLERTVFHRAGFSRWVVAPFGAEQLGDFASRWFGAEKPGPSQAEEFLRQAELAGLHDTMTNPLLAAVAAAVFEAWPDRILPANRYALYEQYRAYLVSAKSLQREAHLGYLAPSTLRNPVALDCARFLRDHFDDLLRHLALATVTETSPDLLHVALSWLTEQLGPRARTSIPGWGEQVAALLTTSGLVVSVEDRLRFLHVSFAEHLAAEARSLCLPARFDPTSRDWTVVLDQAVLGKETPAQTARAALLHFAHRHPLESARMLSWLQQGTKQHQQTAGLLLAEGSPATPAHVASFLEQLPFLPTDCWSTAGHLADPSAHEVLRSYASSDHPRALRMHALAALAVRHPHEAEEIRSLDGTLQLNEHDQTGVQKSPGAQPPLPLSHTDDGWETSALVALLEQLTAEDIRAEARLFSELVCDGSLENSDRRAVIYRLCEAAPEEAHRTAQCLQHTASNTELTPCSRLNAAQGLSEFGGRYLTVATATFTSMAEDVHCVLPIRLAAAECLADLGGQHVEYACRLLTDLAQQDIKHPIQRMELQEALAELRL
ncbi:NACHT domain-containing protein [Streptomyces mirabilis]|uniref:NACHT domain-containing protein n=1 Tax=Streptomyces mirabilis TaxID=68239 RepID=UPI00332427EA